VYGPGMRDELLIPTLLRRAFAGLALQLSGGGQQARNFVYVDDLAMAHLMALSDRCANHTFNLDGLRPVTVCEVAERVCELVGGSVTVEHTPGRPGDYSRPSNKACAKRSTGIDPPTPHTPSKALSKFET
jgi:UDP-glucose 4-epimerase